MSQILQTHAAVRLRPANGTTGKQRWVADQLIDRRRFLLPLPAVAALIACMEGLSQDRFVAEISRRFHLPADGVAAMANSLADKRLLVAPEDQDHRWVQRCSANFYKYNWIAAWDYFLVAMDYQFVDYHADGLGIARMNEYARAEPDNDRSKQYTQALSRISLPAPSADLLPAPMAGAKVMHAAETAPPWTSEELMRLLAMGFGRTGYLRVQWPNASQLYRKTSPSGGARHPTEAYLVALDVPGLEPGWYHFATAENELELISRGATFGEMERLFPGPVVRSPFPVRGVVILTSLFERNMYRYREPRTFRSVHLDVGHISSFLETAAASVGIRTYPHFGLREDLVEKRLGLTALAEGAVMAVALG